MIFFTKIKNGPNLKNSCGKIFEKFITRVSVRKIFFCYIKYGIHEYVYYDRTLFYEFKNDFRIFIYRVFRAKINFFKPEGLDKSCSLY